MNETIYIKILNMVYSAFSSEDDDEKEIAIELAKSALKYTEERLSWNWLSFEDKDANNESRTRIHNRLIDCFNIFLRYEARTHNTEFIDLSNCDRKTIGDIGNRLVSDLAIYQR